MTAALFSRGKGRRAAAAVGAVTLGLVALTACDKPTPLATVTVGSTSKTTEATKGCYTDGKALEEEKWRACLNREGTRTLTVHSGEKVRVGVDPEIAESGWTLVAGGRVVVDDTKATYRSFDSDLLFVRQDETGQLIPLKEVTLTVVEAGESGPKGLWHFNLKQES
ncbi:hypothetical protein LRS74_18795 [Streptomyces sp. LX-29]|uniref:hypothetical protein n=1 Tax=Streptomyces sp. LX-29 TaxID=2900152 RepID=UPI00240D5189|nr:hypothetical protein [Streptomyces sp. LX-29]WFB08861.1 hypothetical protein LRS74_18795 [Streptomyces sp. LX-29]